MRKINLPYLYWIFLLSILTSGYSQVTELKNIQIQPKKDSVQIILGFLGAPPQYNIKPIKTDDISMAIITIPKGTVSKQFNLEVVRPILHVEAIPNLQSKELNIILYLEAEVPFEDNIHDNTIFIDFPWSSYQPLEGKLSRLNQYTTELKDDNNELFKFNFNRIPGGYTTFLTKNKKTAIAIFYNTLTENNIITPSSTKLITGLNYKTGMGGDYLQYTKLIFSSNQELLMDVADEDKELFIEFYGVGDEAISVSETPTEVYNPEEYGHIPQETEKVVSQTSNTWLYVGLGTVAVISSGVAAYLLWFNGDEAEPDEDIIPEAGDIVEFPKR